MRGKVVSKGTMATAAEKREDIKSKLQILRKELREIHSKVIEESTMPEPGEVRDSMTKLEELLEVLEPKSAKKSKK